MTPENISELLQRHSMLSPLQQCALHWVPEGKSLAWYLGFLQALEIHRGIRELFSDSAQPEAYELLGQRIREQLENLAQTRGASTDANLTPNTQWMKTEAADGEASADTLHGSSAGLPPNEQQRTIGD